MHSSFGIDSNSHPGCCVWPLTEQLPHDIWVSQKPGSKQCFFFATSQNVCQLGRPMYPSKPLFSYLEDGNVWPWVWRLPPLHLHRAESRSRPGGADGFSRPPAVDVDANSGTLLFHWGEIRLLGVIESNCYREACFRGIFILHVWPDSRFTYSAALLQLLFLRFALLWPSFLQAES